MWGFLHTASRIIFLFFKSDHILCSHPSSNHLSSSDQNSGSYCSPVLFHCFTDDSCLLLYCSLIAFVVVPLQKCQAYSCFGGFACNVLSATTTFPIYLLIFHSGLCSNVTSSEWICLNSLSEITLPNHHHFLSLYLAFLFFNIVLATIWHDTYISLFISYLHS